MNLIRRHPIGAFLLATYGLTVLIFALPLLAEGGIGVLPIELPGVAPFILLSTLGLAAAAFAITAYVDGRQGVRDLRRRAFRFAVPPMWYIVALLALPLAALAVAVAAQGTGPLEAIAGQPSLITDWLIALAVAAVLVNFWEELGWTGFLLHRLQGRIGPLPASVVTTWAQGALHLPLVFIADGVTDGRVSPEQYPIYLIALFVLPIPVRIILTGLYNRSGQSIPVVGIYHAAMGVATGSAFLPALAPGLDSAWAYAGFAVVAIAVVALTRGRLSYERAVGASRSTATDALGSAQGSAR